MRKSIIISALFLFVFACKKKNDPEPTPQPEPEKTSSLTVKVIRYDSLGDLEIDYSGVNVSIANTSFSAVTNTAGIANFTGLPSKYQVPLLFKAGYDAAPFSVDLTNTPNYTTSPMPVAKISGFKVNQASFSTQFIDKDSITISLTLDKAVPAGKMVKLAVLTGTNTGISALNYFSADIILLNSSSVVKRNIAKLPEFQSKLNTLTIGTNFYIKVTPVSYGLFESNLYNGKILLGDSEPYSPISPAYQKNW